MVKAEKGDTVKVDYTGKLEDGKLFDTSKNKGPFEFEIGSGKVIKGFDDAVTGMKKGEEKEVTIQPEDAYGPIMDKLQQWTPKKVLEEKKAVAGSVLKMKTDDGRVMHAMIKSVQDDKMLLDFNHPLAGKPLVFTFKVVDITKKK